MASQALPFLTPEQYLELDCQAERPSEYFDGVTYPIEATTLRHNRIQQNVAFGVRQRLVKDGGCQSYGQTIRVKLPGKRYAYPDLFVVCDKIELDDTRYQTVLNPAVVMEILSPSTGDFDRGGKAEMYRAIASLKDYVLIAQNRTRIERYSRQSEQRWIFEEITNVDVALRLESIGVEIPLSEIYDGVEFDPDPEF